MTVIVCGPSLKSFLPTELIDDADTQLWTADTKILCVSLPLWCQYCPVSLQLKRFFLINLFIYFLFIYFYTTRMKFFQYFVYSFAWHSSWALLFTKLLTLFFLWCIDCKSIANWHFVHQNTILKHTHTYTQSTSCVWLIKCDWAPV